jgi:ClpP class serine protease
MMEITDFAEGQQWAITRGSYNSLAERMESYKPTADEIKAYSNCADDGEEDYQVINGVAIIPIGGPIGQGLGEFEKGAGAVDVDDVRAELDEAEEDEEVHTILLNFDTPGGMVYSRQSD